MKKLAFLVMTAISGQVFAATVEDTVGLHVSFKSKTVDQTCDDIWTALKTYNYPQYDTLESLGGWTWRRPAGGCEGSKDIKGSSTDVAGYQSEIVSNSIGYDLTSFYIGENRAEGHFRTYGLNIDIPFNVTFKTFAEYSHVTEVFRHATAQTLPELVRDVFKSEENARKLEEHFANGNCLNQFVVDFRWYSINEGNEVKLGKILYEHGEVCP